MPRGAQRGASAASTASLRRWAAPSVPGRSLAERRSGG
jgi:hypothetical protein